MKEIQPQENPTSRKIILPPAGKQEIIVSMAEADTRAGYRSAGRGLSNGPKPEDFPKNFARKVARRVKQYAEELDINSTVIADCSRYPFTGKD